MKNKKATVANCVGCRDNFYNCNNNIGVKRCWMLAEATMGDFLIVGVWQNPPYDKKDLHKKPMCWEGTGVVKVKPEALDAEGYWR